MCFFNHRTCHHLDVHSIPGTVFSIEPWNKTSVPSHHTDWLIYHGSVFTIGSNEVNPPPSEDSWSNYHVLNQVLAGRRTSFAYVQSCTSFEISTNTFISSILGCKFKPRMRLSSICLYVYIYIYAWQMTTYSLQINKSGSFDDETGLWAVRPFPIISIGFWILSAGLGSQLSSTFQKNSNRSSLDKQNSNPLNH